MKIFLEKGSLPQKRGKLCLTKGHLGNEEGQVKVE